MKILVIFLAISKLYTTFKAEIIILEIKFHKGAKRLRGERGSGRNDSGANGKVGETTRGRNDSGRKGKWAQRLKGETGKWAKRPGFLTPIEKEKDKKKKKKSPRANKTNTCARRI